MLHGAARTAGPHLTAHVAIWITAVTTKVTGFDAPTIIPNPAESAVCAVLPL